MCIYICCCLVTKSCLTLLRECKLGQPLWRTVFGCCLVAVSCNPLDCSPPGSVHGILQARILEWVVISLSRRSSWPRDRTPSSALAGGFTEPSGKPIYIYTYYSHFLYLFICQQTLAISTSWLLWIMLQWAWEYSYLFKILILFPLDMYPKVGRTVGSYDSSIFNFLMNLHTIFLYCALIYIL